MTATAAITPLSLCFSSFACLSSLSLSFEAAQGAASRAATSREKPITLHRFISMLLVARQGSFDDVYFSSKGILGGACGVRREPVELRLTFSQDGAGGCA